MMIEPADLQRQHYEVAGRMMIELAHAQLLHHKIGARLHDYRPLDNFLYLKSFVGFVPQNLM